MKKIQSNSKQKRKFSFLISLLFVAFCFLPFFSLAQLTWNGSTQNLTNGTSIPQNITISGTVKINVPANATATISGNITGSGSIVKEGAGTLVLTSPGNAYSGATEIKAGRLHLGNNTTNANLMATSSVTINAGCVFEMRPQGTVYFNRVIKGSGTLGVHATPQGKVILVANNTYSGTAIVWNGTLQVGNGSSGSLNSHIYLVEPTSTIRFVPEDRLIFSKNIDGEGRVEYVSKAGKLIGITGKQTHTGATIVESGRLSIGIETSSGSIENSNITVYAGAVLGFDRTNNYTYSGIISGAGHVAKSQSSTLTLTGANTYTGQTFLVAGTLALGATGSIAHSYQLKFDIRDVKKTFDIKTAHQTIQSIDGVSSNDEIALGTRTLTIGRRGQNDRGGKFKGRIIGGGTATPLVGIHKLGSGELNLSGSRYDHQGRFIIEEGMVTFDNPANFGLLKLDLYGGGIKWAAGNTTDITPNIRLIASNAHVTFDVGSNNVTFANALPNNVTNYSITKAGSGSLIYQTHATYTGATHIEEGRLIIGANNGLWSSSVSIASRGTLVFMNGCNYFGAITGAGKVDIEHFIANTRSIFHGNNTYTGTTTVKNGSLQINGAHVGDIILNTSSTYLNFANRSPVTYSGKISGLGYVVKSEGSKTILTGTNTYTGLTRVTNGILQVGNGTSGSINSTSNVELTTASSVLRFEPGAVTIFNKVISGLGRVEKGGINDLRFTVNNTYTGTTTVDQGFLNIGGNTTAGSVAGNIILNGGNLTFERSNNYTYSGVISGSGFLRKRGVGTLTLNGINTYSGSTEIYNGTLALGASGSIANSSEVRLNDGTTFDVASGNKNIRGLSGTSISATVNLGSRTLTIGSSGSSNGGGTFAGVFAGTGSVVKNGAAKFTMIGNHLASGTFTAASGTVSFSGSWGGNFVQWGANTLEIVGTPTITGNLEILGGTLSFSTDSRLNVTGIVLPSAHTTVKYNTNATVFGYVLMTAASGITSTESYKLDLTGISGKLGVNAPTTLWINTTPLDNTPPNPGAGVNGNTIAQSVTLSWSRATDNATPQNELRYYIYRSNANNINTLAACQANGLLLNPGGMVDMMNFGENDLLPNTIYYYNVVVEDRAGNRAAYATKAITTQKPTFTGSPAITPLPEISQILSVDISDMTSVPVIPSFGIISYNWQRTNVDESTGMPGTNTVTVGTNATYRVGIEDIGNYISVVITAANCSGSPNSAFYMVPKIDQPAPVAPTTQIRTHNSITLNEISGAAYIRYRMNEGSWQASRIFSGLNPETTYSFQAYYAETPLSNASPISSAVAITTLTESPIQQIRLAWAAAANSEKSFETLINSGQSCIVNWGDGNVDIISPTRNIEAVIVSHTYTTAGHYPVTITGMTSETVFEVFRCDDDDVTELDVSEAVALQVLECPNQQLTELIFDENSELSFVDCRNNRLQLSTLYKISQLIANPQDKLLGTQNLLPRTVMANTWVNMWEQMFFGISQTPTIFTVTKNGNTAIENVDYQLNANGIKFITTGNFVTTMTNAEIVSHPNHPAIVVAIFTVEESIFCGGDGSRTTPYEICDAQTLYNLKNWINSGNGDEAENLNFIITNDIDLSEYPNWEPIGKSSHVGMYDYSMTFQGMLNGNGHVIRNLTINEYNTSNPIGLFGYIANATIQNLGIENCNISTNNSHVGGLAGRIDNSNISGCYVSGTIEGRTVVGGVVGLTANTYIYNCYTITDVIGSDWMVGGFVGATGEYCGFANCYASGNVIGLELVGGFVGIATGTIENCVAANNSVVASGGERVNRFAGELAIASANLNNNYANYGMTVQSNGINIEVVDGSDAAGIGFSPTFFRDRYFYTTAGYWHNYGWNMYESYAGNEWAVWDICELETYPYFRWQQGISCSDHLVIIETGLNGTATPTGINGVVTGGSISITFTPDQFYVIDDVRLNQISVLNQLVDGTLTINNIQWNQSVNATFKFNTNIFCGGTGVRQNPYQICDAPTLAAFAQIVNSGSLLSNNLFFRLTSDIDLSSYPNWEPIGIQTLEGDKAFRGNFMGNNRVIRNLSINKPNDSYVGLFGYVLSGIIEGLGIENCNITGSNSVGGLAGVSNALISNCYVSGNINGQGSVGGLVGVNYHIIGQCYTIGNVNGLTGIGGLVGSNASGAIIENCYSTSNITGNNLVGGLVGANHFGIIQNCVAANEEISANEFLDEEITVNRIVGETLHGTLQFNYANEDMAVIFSSEIITNIENNPNGLNGLGTPMSQLRTKYFYTDPYNWFQATWSFLPGLFANWNICDEETLPFLAWQNNITCSDYIITAYAHNNGSISPNGTIGAMADESITFTFTPDPFYVADKVIVGNSVYDATDNTYTLENINENTTVQVTFKFSPELFCGGDGTEENPYEICSAQSLANFAQYVNAGNGSQTAGKYYILTDNIDLCGYANWEPIGRFEGFDYTATFQGDFDGAGHIIENLTINREEDYIGLFGITFGGKIHNLGIENCNVSGNSCVSGLVGANDRSNITNCYVTGVINGNSITGGLVGWNSVNTITNCYVNVVLTGGYAGGLIGYSQGSTITNCYSNGNVTGVNSTGGLIGYSYATTIQNCVAANSTITSECMGQTNRIVGCDATLNTFNNNYAHENMLITIAGEPVTLENNELSGTDVSMEWLRTSYFYTNVYNWTDTPWDFITPIWNICEQETLPYLAWQQNVTCSDFIITAYAHENGSINPSGIIGVMIGESITFTFTPEPFYMADKVIVGNSVYDATGNTFILENINENTIVQVTFKPDAASLFCGGEGTEQSPYQICDAQTLAGLATFVNTGNGAQTAGVYYILTNNIDLSGYTESEGWEPIGLFVIGALSVEYNKAFQGNFNGNSYIVQNLTINREHTTAVGLFGYARNANIKNLGVENCNIIADYQVGGLIGHTEYTTITNCYTTGNISAISQVGGLVGLNNRSSVIANSFTTCNVTGRRFVGGLVGYNLFATTIMNCVAANEAITSLEESEFNRTNRIVGWNYFNSELINNYASEDMSITIVGQPFYPMDNDENGIAKNIITLQSRNFYTDIQNWYENAWDFDEVWNICESETLPFFITQNTYCLGIYSITATAEGAGTISPEGAIQVEAGNNLTITFTPEEGYMVAAVWVDGALVPGSEKSTSYTFTNIERSHDIKVIFNYMRYYVRTVVDHTKGWIAVMIDSNEYPLTPPWTAVSIGAGYDIHFKFYANEEFRVNQLLIDGNNISDSIPGGSYTFTNLSTDHTMEVTFAPAHIPVTNITDVPTTAIATLPLILSGTVIPSNATNQEIVWSIYDAGTTGATISGNNVLNTTGTGTTIVRATITNGASLSTNYMQNFTITVTKAMQEAPESPELAAATATTIILVPISDCEYRMNGGTWQALPVFTGLMPNTAYSFQARKTETATHLASDPSQVAIYSTDTVLTYTILSVVNNPAYGTIDPAGIVVVEEGGSVTYAITPFGNYGIEDILINGVSQGAITTYIFENVQADAIIFAIFGTVGINENEFGNVKVYSHKNTVFIKNENDIPLKSVEIYDMTGRRVYQNAITDTETAITLHVADAIYYVRLISQENRIMTSKVSITR